MPEFHRKHPYLQGIGGAYTVFLPRAEHVVHGSQSTVLPATETTMTKPSIVFAHGLWADGSCFSKLIPTLQTEGHDVMASQHGLDSLASDVAAVKACLARVPSP